MHFQLIHHIPFLFLFSHKYSGLNLNQDKAASRRQYTRYGKASQRCNGLNLIHYILFATYLIFSLVG